jgi:hypothetical protein
VRDADVGRELAAGGHPRSNKTASLALKTQTAGRPGQCGPMRDHERNEDSFGRLLSAVERSLHLADEIDYRVRRWLIPITLEQSTSSPARNEVQPPPRSVPSYARDAIGRQLRAEYPVEQFMPARLANLLSRFEYQGRAA